MKKPITEFQKMYWLRSVGPCYYQEGAREDYGFRINQLETNHDTVVINVNKEKNSQGIRIIAKQNKRRKRKRQSTSNFSTQQRRNAVQLGESNSLFICGLRTCSNEIKLEAEFKKFGKIKKVKLMRNLKSGRSRRYAFIQYEDRRSCDKAYQHSRETDVFIDGEKVLIDHVRYNSDQS